MKKQDKNRKLLDFISEIIVIFVSLLCCVIAINYLVDASEVIRPNEYSYMAKLALTGNIIAVPENYNERLYQVTVVNEMENIPNTAVIGCSRGMFLGREITGYNNLYNNCVSGAAIEDYYALLGLYYRKFSRLPSRIIIETSPWVFYKDIPESRFTEQEIYYSSIEEFYCKVNSKKFVKKTDKWKENPYLSIPYFQHNLSAILHRGIKAFIRERPKISINTSEAADYPDGSIRYNVALENPSKKRLEIVQSTKGAVKYQNVNLMTEIDENKKLEYENLLNFLMDDDVEIIIFMQPFSLTQCHYIYDEKTNPIFSEVEEYLRELATKRKIKIVGSFNARNFKIFDEDFIDFMHLDKKGTKIVWNSMI